MVGAVTVGGGAAVVEGVTAVGGGVAAFLAKSSSQSCGGTLRMTSMILSKADRMGESRLSLGRENDERETMKERK